MKNPNVVTHAIGDRAVASLGPLIMFESLKTKDEIPTLSVLLYFDTRTLPPDVTLG